MLNPRVDFAFKMLFGSEDNKDLLISLVNAIISPEEKVVEITLLNPYNDREHATDRQSVLDIKAKDIHGRLYNIEMQVTDDVDYDQRALYYWSRLYCSQLQKGDAYRQLKKTISIHILNFNCFDEAGYHHEYHLLNAKTHKRHFEDLELHFIELEKFDKELSQLKTALDRWTDFLKKAQKYDQGLPKELQIEPEINKAYDVLRHMHLTDKEREIYDAHVKWLWAEQSAIEKATMVGRAEGREEGREEGRAEGREEGREEGRVEEKLAIAQQLFDRGMDIVDIAEVTGLSLPELEQLLKG